MKAFGFKRLNVVIYCVIGMLTMVNNNPAWSTEFCVGNSDELNTAIAIAASNGVDDVIKIQQGTYYGNFVYASTEPYGVTIEGGFIAECISKVVDPANTVLDAGSNGPVLVFSTPDMSADFTMDGLTLQNGNVNIQGGGLYAVTSGTVTLTNNTISYNNAESVGGGIYSNNGTAILTNNTISNNSSNSSGGGGYIHSDHGPITLTSNIFSGNIAAGAGGLFLESRSGAVITLTNNTLDNNSTQGGGNAGGGWFTSYHSPFILTNNTISNNNTNSEGGGIYFYLYFSSVTLTNNTIINNNANSKGGGIRLRLIYDDSSSNIHNNIIWNNSAGNGGSDLYIENDPNTNYLPSTVNLYNNDFDQSSDGTYIQIPFPIDPSNLDNEDPLFVDSANDDYHLTAGSPCKDTGGNTAPELPEKDMDGQPRIMDGVVDMGAYEYPGAAEPIADFSAEPLSGPAPLTVNFTDKSGGTIDSWEWDFGDGSPSSHEQNPSHVYDSPGIYTVTLTVNSPYGPDTEIKADYITADLANPKPDIKVNGQDDPISVFPTENVNITVSLDPGSFDGEWFDWWIGVMSPYVTFPFLGQPIPLFELPEISIFDSPLPTGLWLFYFILDDNPNYIFDSMAWFDYVVVIAENEALDYQMEDLSNYESLFQDKIKELMRDNSSLEK